MTTLKLLKLKEKKKRLILVVSSTVFVVHMLSKSKK